MKTVRRIPRGPMLACAALVAIGVGACDGDNATGTDSNPLRSVPNNMTSASQVDTVNATAVFPLYRGEDMDGNSVFYIITESTNVDESIRLGINWAPKMIHAMGTKATQRATIVNRGRGNPNNFPVVRFSGNVDFSPVRKLVPGKELFPLDPSTTPGSVGDEIYSPLFTFDDSVVFNGSHLANRTGMHDKVISMDTVGMTVKLQLVKGFYEGFAILYSSTETTDNDLSALETGTFAPNMNFAPFPGDDKPFRSAREALIPVVNGPTGRDNPSRQGLRSAVLGEGDPLNIFQEQAGCQDADNPAAFCDAVLYSPLWDVHPVMWTQEAIDKGIRDVVTTDKREVIAPLNVIDLLADGYLVPFAPNGPRNSTLGGLNAAGIIVNCPIVFVPEPAR
jgi:hypothetical protein